MIWTHSCYIATGNGRQSERGTERLGQAQFSTLMNIHAHVVDDEDKQAADKFEEALSLVGLK